jgi:hypothetical protein
MEGGTDYTLLLCEISGFRREVDENCALLGYYAVSRGNSLPTFRDQPRNVGNEFLLLAV